MDIKDDGNADDGVMDDGAVIIDSKYDKIEEPLDE